MLAQNYKHSQRGHNSTRLHSYLGLKCHNKFKLKNNELEKVA